MTTLLRRPTKPTGTAATVVIFLVVALFVGVMLTCIVSIGIWPGEAKLLSPILCTDARPDAVVVSDTYSPRPGETVTNFSLYCVGPRGDFTDHGWATVFLLLTVFHTLIAIALLGALVIRAGRRSRARLEPASNPLIS